MPLAVSEFPIEKNTLYSVWKRNRAHLCAYFETYSLKFCETYKTGIFFCPRCWRFHYLFKSHSARLLNWCRVALQWYLILSTLCWHPDEYLILPWNYWFRPFRFVFILFNSMAGYVGNADRCGCLSCLSCTACSRIKVSYIFAEQRMNSFNLFICQYLKTSLAWMPLSAHFKHSQSHARLWI